MKIKKNGNIITLTESDLEKIVKKLITEEKISFKNCNKHPSIWEWFIDSETDEGKAAAYNKKLFTCSELLQNDNFNAGFLSKITDIGRRDKMLKKSVQYCMRTIKKTAEAIEILNPNDYGHIFSRKHIKDYKYKTEYIDNISRKISKEIKSKIGEAPSGRYGERHSEFDEWSKKAMQMAKEKWDPIKEEMINQLKEVSQCLHRSYF